MVSLQCWNYTVVSIPLHGIAVSASLVVFQGIGECRCVATEAEVVAGVWCEHYGAAHVEAVEVALQRGCGHGHGLVLKVVAAGEADVPSVA